MRNAKLPSDLSSGMALEDAGNLLDGLGILVCGVVGGDDFFGDCRRDVGTPIRYDAIGHDGAGFVRVAA